jgi:hypothetical protein
VSVDVNGERYLAKIDCYAPDMEHGSEGPAGPTHTVGVLTIIHCSDYRHARQNPQRHFAFRHNVEKRGEYGIMAQTPQAPDRVRT